MEAEQALRRSVPIPHDAGTIGNHDRIRTTIQYPKWKIVWQR
jgi:hypothetical protein